MLKPTLFSVVVALLWAGSAAAADLQYEVDTVPSQTVWHDTTLQLDLSWTGHPSASFDAVAAPEPFGVLSIRKSSEPHWTFEYSPALEDRMPFHVLVTASDGDASISHSFLIVPMARLAPEETVFDTRTHTRPGPLEDVIEIERTNPGPVDFNYDPDRTTVDVALIGETLIFDQATTDGDDLYNRYEGRQDIETLELVAQRVVFRSPLHVLGTDVRIWAEEVVFEGAGAIITTPLELQPAAPGADGAIAGKPGLPAGDLELHVRDLVAPEGAIVFDLTGGRGQQGSPGDYGTRGQSATYYWQDFELPCGGLGNTCSADNTPYSAPDGRHVIYAQRNAGLGFPPLCVWAEGQRDFEPGDGTDAVAGGQPGYGGPAGNVVATVDIASHLTQQHGDAGRARTYSGGAAGFPSRWVKVFYSCGPPATITNEASGESQRGADAADPPADDPGHAAPVVVREGGPYSWVHPLLMKKRLEASRAAYLGSQLDDATTMLRAQHGLLIAYTTDDPSWSAVGDEPRRELEEMVDEIQILLEQLESGRDYFGQPAGWVPMLSFEVNAAAFDQEIDRALETIYLNYWIQNRAQNAEEKVASLRIIRERLKVELADAMNRYDEAIVAVPVLRQRGRDLEVRTMEVQRELAMIEAHLTRQAADNLRPPWWEISLRLGAKTAGMICNMIPVYQPYLGAVGSGLTLVSNLDPEKPWETIIGGTDVVSNCLDSLYNDAVKEQSNKLKKIDPNSDDSIKIGTLDDLRNSTKALSAGMTEITGYLSNLEASEEEIQVELEKLKADSEAFITTVEAIEDLLATRRDLVDELTGVMRDVAYLPNLIAQYLLELDAMNQEIEHVTAALDKRTLAYLREMDQRANDRLLQYHYYLAKAYEYRLLKPYEHQLDLTPIREGIQDIGELYTRDELIRAEDFLAIKSLYRDRLAEVAQEIFEGYNVDRPERSAPVRFELSPGQLGVLNSGGVLTLDPMTLGLFSPGDENIRIVDIQVFDIQTTPVGDAYPSTTYIDVELEHPGVSRIKSDGDVFEFRHYTSGTSSPIVWGTRYDPVNDQKDAIRPSAASESLLRSLLSQQAQDDMMLYSRPSAWADLRVTATENDGNRNVRLEKVVLEMTYDFTKRNDALGLVELEVGVMKRDWNAADELVVQEATFEPYFIVDAADANERQDGRGNFLRFFPSGVTQEVRIEAQPIYGVWHFVAWVDHEGNQLSNVPSATFTLSADRAVFAYYERDVDPPPNHAPSAPQLVSPEDGAKGVAENVELVWLIAEDPDGDALEYFVTVCRDPTLATCQPIDATKPGESIAGFELSGLVLVFLLPLGAVAVRRKRRAIVAVGVALLFAMPLFGTSLSCSGDPELPANQRSVDVPVESGTTYWWRVQASDGRGAVSTSETWSFQTE